MAAVIAMGAAIFRPENKKGSAAGIINLQYTARLFAAREYIRVSFSGSTLLKPARVFTVTGKKVKNAAMNMRVRPISPMIPDSIGASPSIGIIWEMSR